MGLCAGNSRVVGQPSVTRFWVISVLAVTRPHRVDQATHRRLARCRSIHDEPRSKYINNAQIVNTIPISIRPKCHGDVATGFRKYRTWEIAIEVKKNRRLIELAARISRSFAPSCEFGSMNAHVNVYMSSGRPSTAIRREKNARFQSESSCSNTGSSPRFNPSQLTSELEKPVVRILGELSPTRKLSIWATPHC
jgi:hypothetical protein